MKTLITLILWFILFSLSWPLALGLLLVLPIIWLVLLPFRILGFTLEIVFSIVKDVILFPFRVLRRA
ncbi:MAG: hypothetical protein JXR03_11215 [Cyclobacteriaceae bacterium]